MKLGKLRKATIFINTIVVGATVGLMIAKATRPAKFTDDMTVVEMYGNPTNIPTKVDSLEEYIEKKTPEVTEKPNTPAIDNEEPIILNGNTNNHILVKRV